jgi:hypothetical protein
MEARKQCDKGLVWTNDGVPLLQGNLKDKDGSAAHSSTSTVRDVKQDPRNFLKKGAGVRSRVGPSALNLNASATNDCVLQQSKRNADSSNAVQKEDLQQQQPISKLSSCSTDDGNSVIRSTSSAPRPDENINLGVSAHIQEDIIVDSMENLQSDSLHDYNLQSIEEFEGISEVQLPMSEPNNNTGVCRISSSHQYVMVDEGKHTSSSHDSHKNESSNDPSNTSIAPCMALEPMLEKTRNRFVHPVCLEDGKQMSALNSSQNRQPNTFAGSGVYDESGNGFLRLPSKWDKDRHISSTDSNPPTNNHGRELKWYLKFGRRGITSNGHEQSPSIFFSDGDDIIIGEPGDHMVDCYGRKRHSNGKSLSLKASCNSDLQSAKQSPLISDRSKKDGDGSSNLYPSMSWAET